MHPVRDRPIWNGNRLDFTDPPQDRMTQEIVCGSGDRSLPGRALPDRRPAKRLSEADSV